MRSRTKTERETIIRWDDGDDQAYVYTASPKQARWWHRWGLKLVEKSGAWTSRIPKVRIAARKISLAPRKGRRTSYSAAAAVDHELITAATRDSRERRVHAPNAAFRPQNRSHSVQSRNNEGRLESSG